MAINNTELKVKLANAMLEYIKVRPNSFFVLENLPSEPVELIDLRKAVKALTTPYRVMDVRDCGNTFSKTDYHFAALRNGFAMGYFSTQVDAEEYIEFLEGKRT